LETSASESKPRRFGVALPWVFVLMIGSFVLGGFVGLHPSWLPIPSGFSAAQTSGDEVQPSLPAVTGGMSAKANPEQTTQPTTQGQ
jgi:hypothetical protein